MEFDLYNQFPNTGAIPREQPPEYSIEKIITQRLSEEKKRYFLESWDGKHNCLFDIIAPDGIGNIEGFTVIEIKSRSPWNNGSVNISSLITSKYHTFKACDIKEVKNFLFIVTFPLSKKEVIAIEREFKKLSKDLNISIWDSKDLNQYLQKDIFGKPSFVKVILESSKKTSESYKEERNILINKLSEEYLDKKITLFLGAGVSKNAGFESWDTLMDILQIDLLTKKLEGEISIDDIDRLYRYKKNLIYLEGEEDLFHEANHLILNAEVIKKELGDEFHRKIIEILYKAPKKDSKLIESIIDFSYTSQGNKKISAIITYNYDSLIEDRLKAKNIFLFQPIISGDEIVEIDKLSIFHVHGFIPSSEKEREQSTKLILSDEDYNDLFLNLYHWSNVVQISSLRSSTCLFIGLSFRDPNLRRLLYHLSKEKQLNGKPFSQHYAFVKIEDYSNLIEQIKDPEIIKKFQGMEMEFTSNLLNFLGIKVIWIDDYLEIPILLRRIQEIADRKPD